MENLEMLKCISKVFFDPALLLSSSIIAGATVLALKGLCAFEWFRRMVG